MRKYCGSVGPCLVTPLCLCAMTYLLIGVDARAADTSTSASKSSSMTAEQSPEQAAGGKENLKRMKSACETDASRFCKGVIPGGGRIIKCLREHEPELAPNCREAIQAGASKP